MTKDTYIHMRIDPERKAEIATAAKQEQRTISNYLLWAEQTVRSAIKHGDNTLRNEHDVLYKPQEVKEGQE